MTKICPKCKNPFTCSGDSDCWCEDVQIHKKEMLVIMEMYTDCLCPDCLGEYSEK
ncbi:MAG: cysteine-rich CWC family protein [Bacteroidales bacterium]|nr:cysteine-rich CWC family protein [Bacteroidales bacterium]MCF8392069.1 cysteine-rich CWC family protein [Bacteroidales bacterium]